MRRPSPRGFTLVELLVVIAIVALISAVALPVILPALNERRVSEAARLLQAVLAGTRDAAIRANAPRGIRLLPDPVFNPNAPNALPGVLASDRFVAIEPAPDYAEGEVNLLVSSVTLKNITPGGPGGTVTKNILTIGEVAYVDAPTNKIYGNPTSWYWNIRQGDRIRFNDAGDYYTIVGPMHFGPPQVSSTSITNAERYVNVGAPANTFPGTPQFLYVLNGEDDNDNGFVDEAFDGIDNDGDGIIDPSFNGLDDDADGIIDNEYAFGEFEEERYDASQYTPFAAVLSNVAYTIYRRPVVSPMARETTLPSGIVIDMTTWNAPSATPTSSKTNPSPLVLLPERSRLPIDPYTYYVDIMISPNGQVVQGGGGGSNGDYNGLAPAANQPFYHFWLTEREGVVSPLWGEQTVVNASKSTLTLPALNPNYGAASNPQTYLLPMPKGTPNYTSAPLTGERRLVTLFVKTGQIVTGSIESFNGNDTNAPFYDAQSGIKEQQ